MNQTKRVFYYLLWTVGAGLMFYYSGSFIEGVIKQEPLLPKLDNKLLADLLFAFIVGLYLSLLNGLPARRGRFNRPLFYCVFMPCCTIMFYPIITTYFPAIYVPAYFSVVTERVYFFFGMLSGLTLVRSFRTG